MGGVGLGVGWVVVEGGEGALCAGSASVRRIQ